jgi:hypothetical protein
MCILPPATPSVSSAPAPTPARQLPPASRQQLARDALRGQPITTLAHQHQVSRKFVYQQLQRADDALAQAFTPADPAPQDLLFWLPVTKPWLRQLVLSLVLIGHSSLRGVQELLADVFDYPLALGTIHHFLHQEMAKARTLNQAHDLGAVRVGALDEIFQAGQPVLVGVDVDSTFCFLLSVEAHRDADTWGVRLLEAHDRGLQPEYFIADFGQGLRAGQAAALPEIPCRGDLFPALQEGPEIVTTLENQAYRAREAFDQLERQQAAYRGRHGRANPSTVRKLVRARARLNAARTRADEVTVLLRWLRHDILAVNELTLSAREELYDFVVGALQRHAAEGPDRLQRLATCLRNHRTEMLSFAVRLEQECQRLAETFAVPLAWVRALLEVQARDARDPRRWQAEAALRQQLRGRFHDLQEAVATVVQRTVRASSVIENLNSRLRNYFTLRRQLGPDYLALLQFFLNHRRFVRSAHPQRVGRSPAELLRGQAQPHWLELLGYQRFTRN